MVRGVLKFWGAAGCGGITSCRCWQSAATMGGIAGRWLASWHGGRGARVFARAPAWNGVWSAEILGYGRLRRHHRLPLLAASSHHGRHRQLLRLK
jgi:hypothetical protein